MADHELKKLFGGFTADTLTPEERKRLYSAALQDQQLFNALADEQALKELLTDPDVRLRLLQAVQQPGRSATDGTNPRLAWLKQPAGLAWAGGFAAAVLAIAFGINLYQESLDRAVQPVATEEAKPAAPSIQRAQPSMQAAPATAPPELTIQEHAEPARKDSRSDKFAARKEPAPATTQERRASQAPAEQTVARSERDASTRQAPLTTTEQDAEQLVASADRKLAASAPSPAAAPKSAAAPPALQAPAGLSTAGDSASKKSARAIFYGESSEGSASQPKPLGLRYSFVTRTADGRNQEITAAMAARSSEPVRMTVEATQESYVQLLQNLGSAGTRLWWPPQETGKISLKLQAGKRSEIPMPPPAENGLVTIIVRLSSKPFGPLTMQEVGMLDRFSANLLIETASPGVTTGVQEQATYVVSQDPSTSAQLAVEIPIAQ